MGFCAPVPTACGNPAPARASVRATRPASRCEPTRWRWRVVVECVRRWGGRCEGRGRRGKVTQSRGVIDTGEARRAEAQGPRDPFSDVVFDQRRDAVARPIIRDGWTLDENLAGLAH